MRVRIDSILTGRVAPQGPAGRTSAIAKSATERRLDVSPTGLEGDQQADLENHGGHEKAIHHYPRDHYEHWKRTLGSPVAILDAPGAFGENVSTRGVTEESVCVGDTFEFGTALVQVSQARQPCWKLNARFGHRSMAREVQSSRLTGWYYRVLRPGSVSAGDEIVLVDRVHEGWTLTRLMDVIYDRSTAGAELEAMASLTALASGWRELAAKRLKTRSVEDWSGRLGE